MRIAGFGKTEIRYDMFDIVRNAEEARRELRAVLALRPNVAEAHYALATLEKSRGEIMAADAEFREYLRLAPAGAHIEVARANLMRRVPR